MSACTGAFAGTRLGFPQLALLSLCALATLGIWVTNPFAAWGYEAGVFALTTWLFLDKSDWSGLRTERLTWTVLCATSLWGFVQLAVGATEYRWATMNAALYWASLAATALCARRLLIRAEQRNAFLQAAAWFGFAVAGVAVLAYFTSPQKVLWIFPSPYPDVWGPFPSRNNFAQFLELGVPVALWLGIRKESSGAYPFLAAAMLAAGLASASRAGGILLVLEVTVVFALLKREERRRLRWFLPAAILCIAIAGAGTLLHRLGEADPMRFRREIFHSTWNMIVERPLGGYGLGTFSVVYPAFAEFDMGAAVEHAHNDWLEWSAEGGVIFAGLWAVWFSRLAGPALRSIWGIGVIAICLHALVDYPFARHGVAAWVFALSGMLCQSSPTERKRQRTGTRHREPL